MKQLNLIPEIDACHFDSDVEDEFAEREVNTHYQSDIAVLDWDDESDFPLFKKWLLETYGDQVKQFESFAISAT